MRNNPITRRALWIGGLAGAAVLAIGGIALASSSKPAATQALTVPAMLKKGRRYGWQMTAPAGTFNAPGANFTVAAVQSKLDSGMNAQFFGPLTPGTLKVVNVSGSTDGSKLAVIIDDVGADIPLPQPTAADQQSAAQAGVTVTITDIGAAA